YRACVDAPPVQRGVQPRHQLTADPRRHRAATHAVRDDIHRRRPVECAVRILVHGVTPAAARRDGELELRPPRREHRFVGYRRAFAARAFPSRCCRLVRRDNAQRTPTLAAVAAALPPEGAEFAPWDGPAALMVCGPASTCIPI